MPRTPAAADSRAHATFSAFSLGAFSLGSFFSFFPLGALRSELIPEIHSLVPSALTWGRDGYHALHDSHATRCRDAVSIYLSVYLSIHPSIYLSIHIYIYHLFTLGSGGGFGLRWSCHLRYRFMYLAICFSYLSESHK